MVNAVKGEAVANHELEVGHKIVNGCVLIGLEFVLNSGKVHGLFDNSWVVRDVESHVIDRLGEPVGRLDFLGVLHLLDQESLLILSDRARTDAGRVLRANDRDSNAVSTAVWNDRCSLGSAFEFSLRFTIDIASCLCALRGRLASHIIFFSCAHSSS
jgi:hypothetical protein